jgi:uncharacterized protein YcfJ
MKKLWLTILILAALVPARAQFLSPEAVGGAFWGTLIGGIAGSDCRRGFSGNGAAIGAGVGLLTGALVGESRRRHYYDSPGYVYSSAPTVTLGYGYGAYGHSGYVYYSPNRYCAPNYYYRASRPNYAVGGTFLGAASGALIGAGSGDAAAGAAIGAASGLLVGSVAEASAPQHERRAAEIQTAPVIQQSAPAPAPMPPAEVTSRPVANSTYVWTTRPQIPDAPRVPDAPTF